MRNPLGYIALILMLTSALSAHSEKMAITLPYGYSVGEVTSDNVNIRSGAGTQYPVATIKYMDAYARQTYLPTGTIKVEPAYKGQLLWVKEEGGWYRIDPNLIGTEKETPQYISKQFVRLIESEPFDFGEITEPLQFVSVTMGQDEDGEEYPCISQIVFYPKGVVVEYANDVYSDGIRIGRYKDGDPCVTWLRMYDSGYDDEAPKGYQPTLSLRGGGTHIVIKANPDDNRQIVVNGIETSFIDLSRIPVDKWVKIFTETKNSEEGSVTRLHYSDFPFFIRDNLDNNYVRVK